MSLYLSIALFRDDHLNQRHPTYHDYIVSFIMKQKLKKLTLNGIHLTGDIIGSILAMDSLKSLTVKSCFFEPLPQDKLFNSNDVLKIFQ